MSACCPANRSRASRNRSSAFSLGVNCVCTCRKMKNAVPPTAAAARMPTMTTPAMTIEIHVLRLLWLIAFSARRPLSSAPYPPYPTYRAYPTYPTCPTPPDQTLLHETTGFVGGSRIVVALGKRSRLLQLLP